MAPTTAPGPERYYSLKQLNGAGYPTRLTMYKKIRSGQVPAVKFGDTYKIRESDLPLIADPVELDFDAVVERLVEALPQSNAEQRRELIRQVSAYSCASAPTAA